MMVAQLDLRTIRAGPSRAASRLIGYTLFEGRPAPVRGQWFNKVVNRHLATVAARAPVRPVDRPVFIVGVGRSGTSILGRLIGVHPEVGFLDEPKAMWHAIVHDEDLMGTYGDGPVRFRLGQGDVTPRHVARAHRLYGWYQSCTRSARVVDKYPELIFREGFVRMLFPDAHIVVITRSPWDVVRSIDEWSKKNASNRADWWGVGDRKWRALWTEGIAADERFKWIAEHVPRTEADHRVRAAVEWLLASTTAIDLRRSVDEDHLHVLRYEDLLRSPIDICEELMERLELPRSEAVLDLATEIVEPKSRTASCAPPAIPAPVVSAIDATQIQIVSEMRKLGQPL